MTKLIDFIAQLFLFVISIWACAQSKATLAEPTQKVTIRFFNEDEF